MNSLSVVILYHNQENLLGRVIYSLGHQAGQLEGMKTEIIVVDNGSRVPLRLASLDPRLLAGVGGSDIQVVRVEPDASGFALSQARNRGIAAATGDMVLFLDADCVPAPGLLGAYLAAMRAGDAVLIGHRYFVHTDQISDDLLLTDLNYLYQVPHIQSDSNFGLLVDRRMPELYGLETHPMPFNCLHGCNFAVPGAALKAVGGFDGEFDGAWGFEDIELGYRLFASGLPFKYVPMAHVFHQDDRAPISVDRTDTRNLHLAHRKIPGYAAYRPVLRASILFPAG